MYNLLERTPQQEVCDEILFSPTCRLRELPRFPHALDTISGTHSASSLPYLSITSVHNFSSSSTCEQSIMNARSIWNNLEAQTIQFRLAIEMRSMAIYLKPKEEHVQCDKFVMIYFRGCANTVAWSLSLNLISKLKDKSLSQWPLHCKTLVNYPHLIDSKSIPEALSVSGI